MHHYKLLSQPYSTWTLEIHFKSGGPLLPLTLYFLILVIRNREDLPMQAPLFKIFSAGQVQVPFCTISPIFAQVQAPFCTVSPTFAQVQTPFCTVSPAFAHAQTPF